VLDPALGLDADPERWLHAELVQAQPTRVGELGLGSVGVRGPEVGPVAFMDDRRDEQPVGV
jgi:hypothetical protein